MVSEEKNPHSYLFMGFYQFEGMPQSISRTSDPFSHSMEKVAGNVHYLV